MEQLIHHPQLGSDSTNQNFNSFEQIQPGCTKLRESFAVGNVVGWRKNVWLDGVTGHQSYIAGGCIKGDGEGCLLSFLSMGRSFHIYACSGDSLQLFPNNTSSDFTIQLSEAVHLEGDWSCGLVEFQLFGQPRDPLYVCCDLVEENFTGEFKLPVLRRVRLKTTQFAQVTYLPIKIRDFNTVRIYLKTSNNLNPSPKVEHTYCTLHFRRHA